MDLRLSNSLHSILVSVLCSKMKQYGRNWRTFFHDINEKNINSILALINTIKYRSLNAGPLDMVH